MDDARTLARLQEGVHLIGDERLLEGWAACCAQTGPQVLGLILVTDARLIFIDTAGGMLVFPILKILVADVTAPSMITFTARFGRMSLTFDTPAALRAMLNLVRQDPAWGAAVINFTQPAKVDGFEPA